MLGGALRDGVILPSGLVVPRHVAETIAMTPRLTGISLFSGAGGMDLGFVQAGCHVLCAVEYDTTCVETYMVNLCRWGDVQLHFVTPNDRMRLEKHLERGFNRRDRHQVDGSSGLCGSGWISGQPASVRGTSHVVVGDVRKVTGEWLLDIVGMQRGEVGCVFGGPPCQGYSVAGKRNVMDPRNSLVFDWARLVTEIHPRTCVMENVPGIVDMVTEAGTSVVDELRLILETGGFGHRDMLRRCIEAQTGIKLVRGHKRIVDADPDEADAAQADLFAEVAA